MLETTRAWEIGPGRGPDRVHERHLHRRRRHLGREPPGGQAAHRRDAEAEQRRGRHRVGRHHDGAGLDLAAVGEDPDSLTAAARDPQHVDAVLDGLLEAERELVGQRLHAQRGQGRHPLEQRLHAEHRELVGGAQVLVGEDQPEERPEHLLADPAGDAVAVQRLLQRHVGVRRAAARGSCATVRSTASAGRCPGAGRARTGSWRSAPPASPGGCGSPPGGPAPCPRSIGLRVEGGDVHRRRARRGGRR